MTLQGCWARMLLCIHGLSAEKVAALMKHYRTPVSLYNAFVEAEAREQLELEADAAELDLEATNGKGKGKGRAKKARVVPAEHMLTMLPGEGRKKIGVAMSEKIYHLFMDPSY